MNGLFRKHWIQVLTHCLLDGGALFVAFLAGTYLRFLEARLPNLEYYWPAMLLGAFIFPCAVYICGLYSPESYRRDLFNRVFVLALCLLFTFCVLFGFFYLNFSTRIGRGVMLISSVIAFLLVLLHHLNFTFYRRGTRERVLLLRTAESDPVEGPQLEAFIGSSFHLVGCACDRAAGAGAPPGLEDLGDIAELPELVRAHGIGRVLCSSADQANPDLYRGFCNLRYSGVVVVPLINLSEEVHQFVPLELVTPDWLMTASQVPHMLYIKKVKRAFDIFASLAAALCLGPVLLAGMAAVRLTSRGPVFYRQVRVGHFGRRFRVFKLRTMRTDAEKDGNARWSSPDDPRILPAGRFLRRYRIDEIPQVLNVLKGEMSFVGPRPERPGFVERLDREIPFNRERLMVQPGITGWAQVNYPYGSSVEDSRRKLEYDLYYMKNMSLFMDLFILLDTVRIILVGGVDPGRLRRQLPPRPTAGAGAAGPGELPRADAGAAGAGAAGDKKPAEALPGLKKSPAA